MQTTSARDLWNGYVREHAYADGCEARIWWERGCYHVSVRHPDSVKIPSAARETLRGVYAAIRMLRAHVLSTVTVQA